MNRFRRAGLLFLALAALSSCTRRVTEAPPRYVVLRFENLSGDASLEWAGRAASEFLSRSLAGALSGPVLNFAALNRLSPVLGPRPGGAPGISAEKEQALLAGATRLITGYVERSGHGVRIAADEFDVKSGKSVRLLTASNPAVLGALTQLSREFSPAAQPYLTSSADALRLYVNGVEGSGDTALHALDQSVEADPNFGPAWVLLVDANIARGNRGAAQELLAKAAHLKLDQFSQANLDLAGAVLRKDQSDRLTAMRQISALSPGDTVILRTAAEADVRAGEFEDAAEDWNKLAAVLPDDANAWNQLGYARAWTGDYPAALAAMKEYARLRPGDPNALDSTGDIHYLFAKYPEAAASYMEANAKNPAFQNGGDLYKAAWAKFYAKDKKGADAAFAQFRAARQKIKAPGTHLLEADWLYRTGRKQDAVALLEKQTDVESKAQLAIWDVLEGDRAAAAKIAAAMGQPTAPGPFFAKFVTLPSASAEEWQRRAQRLVPNPAAEPIRELALGYALILDGKYDDALPVWAKITSAESGADFFARAVYARLNDEREKVAVLPDPNAVNQFAALLDEI